MRRPEPAVLRLLIFVGALVAAVTVLIVFRGIFLPLLLGLGFAYVLDPAVSGMERRGLGRALAAAVIALASALALVLLLLYLVPAIGDQLQRVGERLPEYLRRLQAQFTPWLAQLRARYPEQFSEFQPQIEAAVKQQLPSAAKFVGVWTAHVFGSLFTLVLFILNLIFVPVFTFYLLVDFPKLKQGLRELVPLPYRTVTIARLGEVDEAVSGFLRGQLTIALILATINSIGLMAIGVPLGLVIGIVAGLANMIPYMSLVVGLVPALLLCWAEHASLTRVALVVAVFSAGQLLEGTVLSPRILGKSVNLHPVWVLLAIIIGGSLFGIIGMLLAVPVAAAIQVFARHWLETYRASEIYRGERRGVRPAAGPVAADGDAVAVGVEAVERPAAKSSPAGRGGERRRRRNT